MSFFYGCAVSKSGIVQNGVHIVVCISCENDVIRVPGKDLLVGSISPVGICDLRSCIDATCMLDQSGLVYFRTSSL